MPVTTVRELMSTVVETLSVGDNLAVARRQLERGNIRHLPVVDADEHVIGLLTHRRILEAWVSHGHPNEERVKNVAKDVPVEMLMEKNVRTISPDAPASEAAALLEGHKVGCLPVVEGGKLVGIITEADFVRFARRFLEWEMHGPAAGARALAG
jgi:CBS domain-containing membrane protein